MIKFTPFEGSSKTYNRTMLELKFERQATELL